VRGSIRGKREEARGKRVPDAAGLDGSDGRLLRLLEGLVGGLQLSELGVESGLGILGGLQQGTR
jgi:hypothetical protein